MFIDFLRDAVTNMDQFRGDISTIYMFHRNDNLVATGNHPLRLCFYEVVPRVDLTSHLVAPAYLGALAYLRAMLGLTMMKEEPKVEISYKETAGEKVCATSMRFVANRFEANFECTNPDILNEKDRVRQFPRPPDALYFPVSKDMRKEFDEVAKTSAPKADVRLFTLGYDGTYVRAMFGSGKHMTNFSLTKDITGHTAQQFQRSVSLDRFRMMLKLASDNEGGKAAFHPNAVWVDFATAHAQHMIASPTIREQIK